MQPRGGELVSATVDGRYTTSTYDDDTSASVYADGGRLEDVDADDVTALYVSTEDTDALDEGKTLYRISLDGETEAILSGLQEYNIANGKIVYEDMNDTYHVADLDSIEDEETLSMPDTEEAYLAFLTQMDPTARILLLQMEMDGIHGISADGNTIVCNVDDGLAIWHVGDEDVTVIDNRTPVDGTVTSGMDHDVIDPEGFVYQVRHGAEEDTYDLVYYNGQGISTIATQVDS